VLARPQSEGDTGTTTIAGRNDKRAATAGVLLHLVFISLIGAATVILFAVASVAFLSTIREPITASRVDERILLSSDPSPEPSSEQHSAPKPDVAEMRPAFAPQTALNREEPEIAGAKTSFERPSSQRTFSTTTEPPDAFPTRDRSAAPTHSTEAHGSEPMPAEPLPTADTSVIPETGPSVPPVPTRAELRDQIPGDAEFQQSQPTKLDQDNPASDEKAPAQKAQNRRVSRKTVIQDADLRNRVQKECGPIIFPALRRHCVASFGIHYR
jgi:hypothetical protein